MDARVHLHCPGSKLLPALAATCTLYSVLKASAWKKCFRLLFQPRIPEHCKEHFGDQSPTVRRAVSPNDQSEPGKCSISQMFFRTNCFSLCVHKDSAEGLHWQHSIDRILIWCSDSGVQVLVFRFWCSDSRPQTLVLRFWISNFEPQTPNFSVSP